jgi:hypothetical protein
MKRAAQPLGRWTWQSLCLFWRAWGSNVTIRLGGLVGVIALVMGVINSNSIAHESKNRVAQQDAIILRLQDGMCGLVGNIGALGPIPGTPQTTTGQGITTQLAAIKSSANTAQKEFQCPPLSPVPNPQPNP